MSKRLHHEDGGTCLTNRCNECYAEHRELKRMLADQLGMKQEYEAKLAAKWLLEEEYEAACNDRDAMARMVDDLRSTIRTMCSLIADWRDGNARLGRPRSFVDQRFIDAIQWEQTHPATEVKLVTGGQREEWNEHDPQRQEPRNTLPPKRTIGEEP